MHSATLANRQLMRSLTRTDTKLDSKKSVRAQLRSVLRRMTVRHPADYGWRRIRPTMSRHIE
jgi:hypothetical protein